MTKEELKALDGMAVEDVSRILWAKADEEGKRPLNTDESDYLDAAYQRRQPVRALEGFGYGGGQMSDDYYNQVGATNRVRYFQVLFKNADGKNALTGSIAMENHTGLRAEDCLKYTTQFVRDNLIEIYEVAS